MNHLNNDFWQNLQIARIYRDKIAHSYNDSFVAEIVEIPPPTIYFRSATPFGKPRHYTHEVSLDIPPEQFRRKIEKLFMEFATGVTNA